MIVREKSQKRRSKPARICAAKPEGQDAEMKASRTRGRIGGNGSLQKMERD